MQVSEWEVNFCMDRARIITAILPDNEAILSWKQFGKPRVELSLAPDGAVMCELYIGRDLVERFYPGDYR